MILEIETPKIDLASENKINAGMEIDSVFSDS